MGNEEKRLFSVPLCFPKFIAISLLFSALQRLSDERPSCMLKSDMLWGDWLHTASFSAE